MKVLILIFFFISTPVFSDCRKEYRKQMRAYRGLSKFSKKNKKRAEFYRIKAVNLLEVSSFLSEIYGEKLSFRVAAFAKMRGAKYIDMVNFIKKINEKKIFCTDYQNLPDLSGVLEIVDYLGVFAKKSKK